MKKMIRRAVAITCVLGGLTAGITAATAGTAFAASTGNFAVCVDGNYAGWAQGQPVPNSGGEIAASTRVVSSGCTSIYFGGLNETLSFKIYGIDGSGNIYLGIVKFNPADTGVTVDLDGNIKDGNAYFTTYNGLK
jgi:hypothetical protein